MAKEPLFLTTAHTIQETGKMIRWMALGLYTTLQATLSTLESGSITSLTEEAAISTKICSILKEASTIITLMS